MAEIKNSFLKSKMNKDLDDRLIPNGEYRDARNVSVGKSEEDNIGSLENVIGNRFITDFGLSALNMETCGYFADEKNQRMIVFLTDYQGSDTYNPKTGPGSNCYIFSWSEATGYIVLVSGVFLNFSTQSLISGVSLVEDLLFFTDNRNQPRKINISTAINNVNYYTEENHISVAKYNPWEPIKLIKKAKTTASATSAISSITVTSAVGIEVGMQLISTSNVGVDKIVGTSFVNVTAITGTTVTLNQSVNVASGDILYFLISTMTNKSGVTGWPGDPDYLESRFIRLAYRFKFDDGEYSIMSPFTQVAYVPKQKGYWLNGQEDAAYRSTIVEWMENEINNIEVLVPLPDLAINCQATPAAKYKIIELDILYKESDGIAIKVLETLPSSSWINNTTNIFSFNYQSRKPYKTLTQKESIRVYDKVPTKAFAQEISGNRVIYGNYKNKYTPPSSLNYKVAVAEKQDGVKFSNWIEYPNHTAKQNRNYQVGFVLCDKFGRQSSVILSGITPTTGISGTGDVTKVSTVYSPYDQNTVVKGWFGDALQVVVNSPGVVSGINNLPNSNFSEPGLYAIPLNNSNLGFDIKGSTGLINQGTGPYTSSFETVGSSAINVPDQGNYMRGENTDYTLITIPRTGVGSSADPFVITTAEKINEELYSPSLPPPSAGVPDPTFGYTISPRGWYSYKIVVKQQEHDYYNVYLPGILNGYPQQRPLSITTTNDNLQVISSHDLNIPSGNLNINVGMVMSGDGVIAGQSIAKVIDANNFEMFAPQNLAANTNITYTSVRDYATFPLDEVGKTANIVLFNDNINKVPRDLNEVGPDQKQFRSSVQLFGRVENQISFSGVQFNKQYYPGTLTDTVVNISTATDSGMTPTSLADIGQANLYNFAEDPYIARISTQNSIGQSAFQSSTSTGMTPTLAIYETSPEESALAIFWETATSGLISDLNAEVVKGDAGPAGTDQIVVTYNEAQVSGTAITNDFTVLSSSGTPVNGCEVTNFEKRNQNVNEPGNGPFKLQKVSDVVGLGTVFRIVTTSTSTFLYNSDIENNYDLIMVFRDAANNNTPPIYVKAVLANVNPTITTAGAGAVIPAVTLSQDYVGVIFNTNGDNVVQAINGTAGTNTTAELRYTLSGTGSGNFTLNETSGVLSKPAAGTTVGFYDLTVTVQDAYNISQNDGKGGTVTATLRINIGDQSVNDGVISPCINSSFILRGANTVYPTSIADGESATVSGCWYIADNTISENNLPPIWRESVDKFGPAFHIGGLGSAPKKGLNKGTIVFELNMSQKYDTAVEFGLLTSSIESWYIYTRPIGSTGSTGWTSSVDINDVVDNPVVNPTRMFIDNNTVGSTKYNQIIKAFNRPGEYAIIAYQINTIGATATAVPDQMPQVWVNSNDLNFTSCVIVPDGTNNNYASTSNPKTYRFASSGPTNGYGCVVGSISPTVYSSTPYGEYVSQFYSTVGLTQQLVPADFGNITLPSIAHYSFSVVSSTTSLGGTLNITPYQKYIFSGALNISGAVTRGALFPTTGYAADVQNCGGSSLDVGTVSTGKPLIRKNL